MPDIFQSQTNVEVLVNILPALVKEDNDLIYTKGGGAVFGTTLKDDSVNGGKQLHGGNPVLSSSEEPQYKVDNKATVTSEVIKIEGPSVTRGLFIHAYTSDPSSMTTTQKVARANSVYFWDEVYTTPLGYFTVITDGSGTFAFSLSNNTMQIRTNDVNIVPKEGDYIVIQKVPAGYVKPADANMSGSTPNGSVYSGIFTDGFSNFPIIQGTETFQLKITDVAFSGEYGIDTEYTLTLDKSLKVTDGDEYAIVLLNRENTGLQKELFYDTFETIEVHREQLLGDPYYNVSATKQVGRKNHLNYNNAQYLGLRNLLSGIITSSSKDFSDSPFMVFDIDEDIKDRFLPTPSDLSSQTFEFHLPSIVLQEDTGDNLNILTNYGTIQNDANGVGKYSGLYFKWDTSVGKRYGYIFYDLRIIVIDDAELTLALAYNSNRNYTLPRTEINPGNKTQNRTSTLNLDVIGIEQAANQSVIIILSDKHGLSNEDSVTIEGVRVKVPGTNLVKSSDINGVKYIKRVFTDQTNGTGEKTDRFQIFADPNCSVSVIENGEFINSGTNGQSGKVRGVTLEHNFFMTYRIKSKHYSSTLPYGELQSFNFIPSIGNPKPENTSGSLFVTLPKLTHINKAYFVDDIEFIIGEWETANLAKPFEITGFKNVVVLSYQDIAVSSMTPPSAAPIELVISKANYNAAVARMSNGLGAYDYATNPNGDPTYNIHGNFKHYNIVNGNLSQTLNTAEGKWTIGNIKYKTEVEQYRSKIQIVVGANEWNDTTNPSYDPTNEFNQEKYISEVAIADSTSDKPLIYAKIAPPVKKSPGLDLLLSMTIDW